MEHLQSFISDCDRKTEVAKRRLKETQEELSEEANSKVLVYFMLLPLLVYAQMYNILSSSYSNTSCWLFSLL